MNHLLSCQKLLNRVWLVVVKFLPLKSVKTNTSMDAGQKGRKKPFMAKLKEKNPMKKKKIQMIKTETGFKPAELKDGKWVPIENAELCYKDSGELDVVKVEKKDETDINN